ncbi:hypothetical protein AB0D37_37525 [Streptomyces sp. NPDC048384]
MSWTIERRGRVAVVTMTTNPVNAQAVPSSPICMRRSTGWSAIIRSAPSY